MYLYIIKFFDGVHWAWRYETVIADKDEDIGLYITEKNSYYPQLYSQFSSTMFYIEYKQEIKCGILEIPYWILKGND